MCPWAEWSPGGRTAAASPGGTEKQCVRLEADRPGNHGSGGYADEDGTYYKEIKLPQSRMNQGTDSTDRYTVKVTFPKSNYTNVDYADLIEYMKIDLTAQQIIE